MDIRRRRINFNMGPSCQPVKSFLQFSSCCLWDPVGQMTFLFSLSGTPFSLFSAPPRLVTPTESHWGLPEPSSPPPLCRARPGGLSVWSCTYCIPRYSVKNDLFGIGRVNLETRETSRHWAFLWVTNSGAPCSYFASFDKSLHIFACFSECEEIERFN